MKQFVKDILQEKGSDVLTVAETDTVLIALEKMAEADVGSVVVIDENKTVIGLLSERDYARKIRLKGISSTETPVNMIMSENIMFTSPSDSIEECMAMMTESRHRHLPVLENDKLVGIISIGDLVKATIEEKEFLINQLTRYIKSG